MTQVQQSPAFFVGADSTKPEAPAGVSVSWTWLSTFLELLSLVSWKHVLQCLHSIGRPAHRKACRLSNYTMRVWVLAPSLVGMYSRTKPSPSSHLRAGLGTQSKIRKRKRLFIYPLFKSYFLFTIMSDSPSKPRFGLETDLPLKETSISENRVKKLQTNLSGQLRPFN